MSGEQPAAAGRATPDMPDLLYGQAEEDLRQAVRALLSERLRPADQLARAEAAQAYDTALWHALAADLGCAGLLIGEDLGGAGASFREAAVVAEETGTAAAPVPYLGSAVIATTALLAATGQQPADEDRALLAALAAGETTAALAVPFDTAPGADPARFVRVTGPSGAGISPGAARLGAGVSPGAARLGAGVPPGAASLTAGTGSAYLSGTVAGVADALPADVLLVPAEGVPFGLFAVDARDIRVTRTPVVSLDSTRQLADLTLDRVPARRIAAGSGAVAALSAALTAGAGVLAAEQLGVAQRCLDMTVGYVKERRQFARPVGSFQAVKHRLADLYVLVTQARAASRYAAACLATGSQDAGVAVAIAKSSCGEAAVQAAQECIQLHGGIGFTWEHPAHLYLKRAKSGSIGLGTPDRHRASLAGLADLPGPK